MGVFLNLPVMTAEDVADAVWEKLTADPVPVGSYGELVQTIGDAVSGTVVPGGEVE